MEEAFFCGGFPREREERETFFFFFSRISKAFQKIFTLFLYFSLFFLTKLYIFFFNKMRGYLQRDEGKWGLAKVYHHTLNQPLIFCHPIVLYCLFFFFFLFLVSGLLFVQLLGGLFSALFSSNFVCFESSKCLVSNDPDLARFGATVVEIWRLKGR